MISEIGGSLKKELVTTADMLVEVAEKQGVYFAVALLLDSSYDAGRLQALLPVLESTKGAIK